MRSVIDLAQASSVDVRVHLRRGQRAVAEQLLDHAEVGAAFEQVRRERVAQAVGMGHETAQGAGIKAAAAGGEEERVLGAAGELRSRFAQVTAEPGCRLLTEWDR